ncbi:hypothetical protein BN2877_26260 [Achromobacter xylosoxidans]|nr:hypothetical protein BN2877_26260 [Achromobacter xylosoxidans]
MPRFTNIVPTVNTVISISCLTGWQPGSKASA